MQWLSNGALMSMGREFIFGDIEVLRATGEPCIVCGEPNGNCSAPDASPHHIIGADSVIHSAKEVQLILVEEDVYGEAQITPFTKAKVILAHKGSYVTLEKAKELGIA